MKHLLLYILFCLTAQVFSQNYQQIDEKVKNYPPFKDMNTLVIRVNNDFKTDEEKARAYYTWMARNIAYDLKKFYAYNPPQLRVIFSSERLNKRIEDRKNKKIITQVFMQRKAMCKGFSLLYKELCEKSGIESIIVKGVTKLSANEISSLRNIKNHAWNAVKINNEWKLIDVSWSAGYEDIMTNSWIQRFDDFYFFTNPNEFLKTHFPQNKAMQIVDNPISLETFFETPLFYPKYFNSGLKISAYQKGLLSVSDADKKIYIAFSEKRDTSKIYYQFKGSADIKKLSIKKQNDNFYLAELKYKPNSSNILSLYSENNRIMDFKIEK